MDNGTEQLERFHPLLLKSILDAVRRFEPDFYSHLCRTYNLDADRMTGLFTNVIALGPGQLSPILDSLRMHQVYHDIVYLAGRNSLLAWVENNTIEKPRFGSFASKFITAARIVLPVFIGNANITTMVKGKLQYVEIRDSIFARGVHHEHPLCGFYCGMLAELAHHLGASGPATVIEARCCAMEQDAPTCLIQVCLEK